MPITVRLAKKQDHPAVERLLRQIAQLHADLRPDVFRPASCKYDKKRYYGLLRHRNTPVLIAQNERGEVLGYAMLLMKTIGRKHPVFRPRRILYIDDLCVDEAARGQGIGTALMGAVRELARERGLERIELNVWERNEGAMRFYEQMGFQTQRRGLETEVNL